jgi:hypothetical protein
MKENGWMQTEKRKPMELLIISLMVLIVFDLAALRWGFDSRDGIARREKRL